MAPRTTVTTLPTAQASKLAEQLPTNPECSNETALYDRLTESKPKPADVQLGASICGACPGASTCLSYALESRVSTGMFGGVLIQDMPFRQRRKGVTR